MPGDRIRAGARKIKRIIDDQDRSWQVWKECDLCGERMVVNNWPDRRPRTPRILKRICCPWCEGRKGKRRMAEKIIVERLAVLDETRRHSLEWVEELEKLVTLAQKVQEL